MFTDRPWRHEVLRTEFDKKATGSITWRCRRTIACACRQLATRLGRGQPCDSGGAGFFLMTGLTGLLWLVPWLTIRRPS
jgi:hypothetical protein